MTEPPAERSEPPVEPAPDRPPRLPAALTWLPASPAVVALIAAVLPWFAPAGYGHGQHIQAPEAFCWQAGRIGFLAPLAIVFVAVGILGPRHGWFARSAPPRTYRRDGVLLTAAGVVGGVVLVLTWVLVPRSYSFSGVTGADLPALGFSFARNAQPGFFLAVVAVADALGCGIVYLVAARRESAAGGDDAAGIIENHDGEEAGR